MVAPDNHCGIYIVIESLCSNSHNVDGVRVDLSVGEFCLLGGRSAEKRSVLRVLQHLCRLVPAAGMNRALFRFFIIIRK